MDGAPAEFCGDSTFNGNGNGALMRTLPVALYQCQLCPGDDEHLESFLEPIHAVSSLTHAHEVGLICCGLYSLTLREWISSTDSKRTLTDIAQAAFEKGKLAYNRIGDEFAVFFNDPKYFDDPAKLVIRTEEELPTLEICREYLEYRVVESADDG